MNATVEDLREEQVRGKNVLVRVSFDVFGNRGDILDSLRLETVADTIKILKEKGAKKIILMCYAGRPEEYDVSLSLKPTADFLFGLFNEKVNFVPALRENGAFIANYKNYINVVKDYLAETENSEIVLLENLRFWKEENEGSEEFAKEVASLADVYVQDGFAQAHRAKNATVGVITKYMETKVLGMQMKKEVEYLQSVSTNLVKEGRKPFIFIIAGKKVETKPGIISKINVASKLMDSMYKGDKILVGGAVAYPFILAQNYDDSVSIEEMKSVIGDSYIDKEQVYDHMKMAKEIFRKGKEKGIEIILPVDHLVDTSSGIKNVEKIEKGMKAGDIGEKTIENWKTHFADADTIILSGPVGWYENPAFSKGSEETVKSMAEATSKDTITIGAGGDTAAMVRKFEYHNDFTLVSIGGGATLEFLMDGKLPVMDLLNKIVSAEV
jgi:phosphoglycerate kinase